jgi:hypothetical protein
MNKHTNAGGIIQLACLVGASPQSNRYLMLLEDLPVSPDSAAGTDWTAVETDFGSYARPRIDNKMGTPAAVGSVVEVTNSVEIRISSTANPTVPVKAYAICGASSGSSMSIYAYGLFDVDINPASGQDFVIPIGNLAFQVS